MIGFESETVMDRSHHWIWFRYRVRACVRKRAEIGFVAGFSYMLLTGLGNDQV